jgi:hypothetical protein
VTLFRVVEVRHRTGSTVVRREVGVIVQVAVYAEKKTLDSKGGVWAVLARLTATWNS